MIEEQAEIIKLLNARIFGKKTEKLDKNQLSILSEDELTELNVNSDISLEESTEVKTKLRVVRHRKAKPHGQRAEFLDSLEQVDVIHKFEQKTCTDCHEKLTPIGKKCVYREVGLKQPELFVVTIINKHISVIIATPKVAIKLSLVKYLLVQSFHTVIFLVVYSQKLLLINMVWLYH
ncbi:transposase domain-containing protein [Ligilactobacillus salivarius]|uniref:transposase domain-containing protein n=1 Tax=Ligilactobacillus salivarius TaxID=1624 RepID=UPI003D269E89